MGAAKTPAYLDVLKEFFQKEQEFLQTIDELLSIAPYLRPLLSERDYQTLNRYLVSGQRFGEEGGILTFQFHRAVVIDQSTFSQLIDNLHQRIVQKVRFELQVYPHLATMVINQQQFSEFIDLVLPDFVERFKQLSVTHPVRTFFAAKAPNGIEHYFQKFLILPVQRVAQYPLMIQRLHEELPTTHPCAEKVKQISDELTRLARILNSVPKTPRAMRSPASSTPMKNKFALQRLRSRGSINLAFPVTTIVGLSLLANCLRCCSFYLNNSAAEMLFAKFHATKPAFELKGNPKPNPWFGDFISELSQKLMKYYLRQSVVDSDTLVEIVESNLDLLKVSITDNFAKITFNSLQHLVELAKGLSPQAVEILPDGYLDFDEMIEGAENFIQQYLLLSVKDMFQHYCHEVKQSYRYLFKSVQKEKKAAADLIIAKLQNSVTSSYFERQLNFASLPDKQQNIWGLTLLILTQTTHNEKNEFNTLFSKKSFGRQLQAAIAYLDELNSTPEINAAKQIFGKQ